MVALKRAGIPVERYVAYEIDKYAIQISKKNHPQIEHCGDVTTADFSQYKGFDMVIGGAHVHFGVLREALKQNIKERLFPKVLAGSYLNTLRERLKKREQNGSYTKTIQAYQDQLKRQYLENLE